MTTFDGLTWRDVTPAERAQFKCDANDPYLGHRCDGAIAFVLVVASGARPMVSFCLRHANQVARGIHDAGLASLEKQTK